MALITTQQAAEKLGVTRRRVLALIKTGQLPAIQKEERGLFSWQIAEKDLKLVAKGANGKRGPKK